NKFFQDVKSKGYAVGKDVLYDYTDHIEDAYLAFLVPRFDPSLRKTSLHPKKLFAIDPGMIRALTLDFDKELGRLFENVVYLDLRRLGSKVEYFQTSEGFEVDFLATTPRGEKKCFQVAWDVQDPQTLLREERALNRVEKEQKISGELITLDSYLRKG